MDPLLPSTVKMHNGEKVKGTFSEKEMQQRLAKLREHMKNEKLDACLFTSIHNINYYSDFLYCAFGRIYGLVVSQGKSTSISAGIDYGQPYRRTYGDNITYTDWKKDNFYTTVKELLGSGAKKVGIELDHITVERKALLEKSLPEVTFVDVAKACMFLRMVKSDEEIELITNSARIAEIGAAAAVKVMKEGVPEHHVALACTKAMVNEIASTYPHAELLDTWTWFQSGINTDGAHNPVTSRKQQKGDILNLNCFPMVSGYYVALERTLFLDHVPSERALEVWKVNQEVLKRGIELLKPGARCSDIAKELNEIYRKHNLLQYRTFGYGHSFGVLCHYYGREAGLEIREDIDTVLKPNMVISMEPMVTIPEGEKGAGGYREHDILVITETGNRNLTKFPVGPEHNIIKN